MATAAATEQVFDELLQLHRGIVFKIANTYARGAEDRADLAQEIAMQLWRAWPHYDPQRAFSTWMYRIALNTGISFLRDHTRRRDEVPFDEAAHDIVDDGDHGRSQDDAMRLLQGFTETLAPLDRALLVLYLEDRSTREIAEILGIGDSNVTTKIGRLKQRIRAYASP